jgi:Gamma-glutamyl cyclotransferase, AIG2-like
MRQMFLNGTAMSGQPDHAAVADARFLGNARTAPNYRFIAVRNEFPGLLPTNGPGAMVEGELYEISEDTLFRGLLPEEPAELELGTIELESGEIVNCMHLQRERVNPSDYIVDISEVASWRKYLASLANSPR